MSTHEIVRIISSKVIPWTAQVEGEHFVVARPVMRQNAMPSGVELSLKPIKGKRLIRRDSRKHANLRLHIADWPEANLHEIAPPKLACIVSGTADYLLGKYNVRCAEGNFILIPSGAPHQCKGPFLSSDHLRNGSCQLLHAYAYSHGVFVWISTSHTGQHHSSMERNYLIPNTSAMAIFNLMMEEATADEAEFEIVCNGLLSAFFAIVKREIEKGHYSKTIPKESEAVSPISNSSFADQIQEYVSANCYKPLKLADAAAHFYMSTAQFTRRVRNETDATFVELLTAARIEHAKELLRKTEWTFTAISGLCSFKSSSYFLHLFHQRVGCTPIQYREESRKAQKNN